jgi:hypothetical protein
MYPDRIIRGINWRQVGISSNCVTEGNAYGRDKSNVFYLIDEYYFFFVPAARGLTTRMSVMRLTSVFFSDLSFILTLRGNIYSDRGAAFTAVCCDKQIGSFCLFRNGKCFIFLKVLIISAHIFSQQ